jgi:hypothetical protein
MFEHLKHLLQTKQQLKEDLNLDTSFTPFMAQRWISMCDSEKCLAVNETTNKLYQGINDKNSWYKILQVATSPTSNKYIKYIKKKQQSPSKIMKHIQFTANTLQISNKEAQTLLENNPDLMKQLKKNLGE